MGVLNRIVLILILLAAAGATILSYFLFEKRTDLLKGWDLMANQIDATAKNLDKGSKTNVADQIKTKEFSHRNLADMESRLQKLSAGADKVVKQRDELAQAICDISAAVGVTADKETLLDVNSYVAHKDELKTKVDQYKRKNDAIAQVFSTAGSRLSVATTANAIKDDKGDQGRAYVSRIHKAVDAQNAKIAERDARLQKIAQTVGVGASNQDEITKAVAKQKAELNKEKAENRRKTSEITRLNNRITGLTREKDRYVTDNKKKAAEIADLKKRINPTNNPDINRIEYQKKDAQYYLNLYALVRNQVKRVDTKWNFVTIDLGAKREVQQTFAGRTYKTLLNITPGKTMTIVRGISTNTPKVIGKITLRDVHADYSNADIQLNTLRDKIQEGDAVIFLEDDMKLLKADIEKLLKK